MTSKNNILFITLFVALGIAFISLSYNNFHALQQRIETHPDLHVDSFIRQQNDLAETNMRTGINSEISLRALLEGHLIQRRYHQANSLLIGKLWINYLGFLTGMILSLMGGFFVLGKFREPEFKGDIEQSAADISNLKMKLATSSPGLFLTLMGTFLMLATIFSKDEIDIKDRPTYLQPTIVAPETSNSQSYDSTDHDIE